MESYMNALWCICQLSVSLSPLNTERHTPYIVTAPLEWGAELHSQTEAHKPSKRSFFLSFHVIILDTKADTSLFSDTQVTSASINTPLRTPAGCCLTFVTWLHKQNCAPDLSLFHLSGASASPGVREEYTALKAKHSLSLCFSALTLLNC